MMAIHIFCIPMANSFLPSIADGVDKQPFILATIIRKKSGGGSSTEKQISDPSSFTPHKKSFFPTQSTQF